MPIIAIAIFAAAALGAGSAAAAQSSLPGDALWNFKTYVSEQVSTEILSGRKAKAESDLSAIDARFTEARRLNAASRLNARALKKIEDNLGARAASLKRRIELLKKDGNYAAAADVSSRFQAAMAAHAAALSEAQAVAERGESTSQKAVLDELARRARVMLDDASEISAEISVASLPASR